MSPIILDVLVVGVIALFAYQGWKKGLVMTLCGLLALAVAYVGAVVVSRTFSPQLAAMMQPAFETRIEQVLQDGIDRAVDTLLPGGIASQLPEDIASQLPEDIASQLPEDIASQLPEDIAAYIPEDVRVPDASRVTLSQAMELLESSDLLSKLDPGILQNLLQNLYQRLLQAVRDNTVDTTAAAATAIAGFLALNLSRFLLFYLTFVVVLIAWKIFSHALDLACRLPVLRTFNETGGMLLGVLKGAVLLLAAVWLLGMAGLVSAETIQQTYLFRLYMNFQLL